MMKLANQRRMACLSPKMRFRGRDAHYWAPPAQIHTCGFPACGSYLRWLTAVADPMFQEANQPFLADRSEEVPDVGVNDPVHLPLVDCHAQGVQRIVRSSSG